MNFIYWNCGMKTLLMQLRKERLEKKQACRDLSPDLCYTGKCGALTNWVSRPLGRGGRVGGEEKESRGGGLRKETNALDPLLYPFRFTNTLVPEFFVFFSVS